jgi:hypothetical protein
LPAFCFFSQHQRLCFALFRRYKCSAPQPDEKNGIVEVNGWMIVGRMNLIYWANQNQATLSQILKISADRDHDESMCMCIFCFLYDLLAVSGLDLIASLLVQKRQAVSLQQLLLSLWSLVLLEQQLANTSLMLGNDGLSYRSALKIGKKKS